MTDDLVNGDGWRAAEQRVGTLYRALGYDVTRDVLNRGSQIDLIAEKRDPVVGRIRIHIEVKDHPGSSLPVQEVRDFIANARNAIGRGDCDKAHLVTSGSVTRHGRAEVEGEPHMSVMTYDELERRLLRPDAALTRWLDDYKREPINRRFVDVTAAPHGSSQIDPAAVEASIASTALLDVALHEPTLGVIVLADYGSGKSTMLQRIKALAIRRRSADPSAVTPILIELRDVSPDFDIEQVALGACRTELGLELPADSFWGLLRNGRFLFLLDGFDEITLHASEATRERLLAGISPLLFGASPAILTSRPSYFASFEEYGQLLSRMRGDLSEDPASAPDERRISHHADQLVDRYRIKGPKTPVASNARTFKLDPLTSAQIDMYLEHASPDLEAAGTTPQDVRQFLNEVYDLSDLIKRPIILEMAVTSTVEGVINPSQGTLQDGPSGLYEAYARVRLQRDWVTVENRQELLTHAVRMRFAEECALHMDDNDALRVDRDQITEVAARTLALGDDDDLDAVLTDLRTCSFLTIGDSGALEFIHRSYQEFFVARRIRHDLLGSTTSRLRAPLPWEYAYFLGSMGYTNADVYQKFKDLAGLRTENDPVADNAAQAVLVAREVARGLDWHNRKIHQLRRPRTQIVESTLQSVQFGGLRVEEVELQDCTLDVRVGDGHGSIGAITLTSCNGQIGILDEVGSVNALGGNLRVTTARGGERSSFESMHLDLQAVGSQHHTLRQVTGRIRIEGVQPANGSPRLDVDHCEVRIEGSDVIDGSIADSLVDVDLDGWDSLGTELTRTAVVVRGARPRTKTSEATKRPRKILDEAPAGSDSVLVVDPSVTADPWWARQRGLVTIGARIPDARTRMLGLFLFEQQRPSDSVSSRRDVNGPPDAGVLGFWTERDGTIVMEGRGPKFDDARDRVSRAIKEATARSVANGQWIAKHFRVLLEELGCPSEAVDQLTSSVDARVANAGTSA